jgi:hypothetical protein
MTREKKQRSVLSAKKKAGNSIPETVLTNTMSAELATAKAPAKTTTRIPAKARSVQVSIEEVIRLRAYEIYLQRGGTPGNPREDWNVAEREVRAHFGRETDA